MASELERLQAALPRRYTIVRELDRGGMSRVYLAREELPERDVAIKVLDEELSARLGRERFVREVEVTSRLGHPHIVPIHAAGEADGTLYYVMPFIDGESLRDLLESAGQLAIDEALRITLQVADALEHAHRQDIVHRDIKPANILFQSGHAVVADFGIARAVSAAEGGQLTQAGLSVGTPDYMSPEQAAGDQPVDGRTDIYALGCVLYEMLGGQAPFHSRTAQATLARHLADTMPSLRAIRTPVPEELEQVIRKALAKAPGDRFQSAAEFAEAIRGADARGTGTVITPATVHRRSAQTPFRRSLSVAGTLLVVAALGLAYQAWSARDPAPVLAGSVYEDSVAVMPLDDRTGDPAYAHVGQSVADEIISHLAEVPEVKVISTYSVVSLWEQNLGIPKLLDTLDVGYLFDGFYELRDGQLVITVSQLDQAGVVTDRSVFRSDPAARDSLEFAAAHEVAEGFLSRIGLSGAFVVDEAEHGPGRDAYLQGNAWMGQRTPDGMRRAIARFREAIQLEETSAPAHASLSSAYTLALFYMYDVGVTSYGLAARALSLADRAVVLDSDYAGGHTARGFTRGLLGQEIDEAEAAFDRALELAPNAPDAPSWSARILEARGLIGEAFREARRARDLDPVQSGRRMTLAGLAFQRHDYDMAIDEAREALRLEPRLTAARAVEGRALTLTGRAEECLRLDFGVYELVRALCLHVAGREQEALELASSAERALTSSGVGDPFYMDVLTVQDLAAYYGFTGDAARATRWTREAFDLSPFGVDSRVLASGLFDRVRDDPDFSAMLEQVVPEAWARVLEERRSFELAGGL